MIVFALHAFVCQTVDCQLIEGHVVAWQLIVHTAGRVRAQVEYSSDIDQMIRR